MTKLENLEKTLELLRKYGCSRYKSAGVEIELGPQLPVLSTPHPAQDEIQEIKIAEEEYPPDLRADDLMREDQVLNWSSPDAGDGELPLTMSGGV